MAKATKTIIQKKLHADFEAAVNAGDVDALSALLEANNIDINASFNKRGEYSYQYERYLFIKIFEGEHILKLLDFFYSRGVNINLTDNDGQNALFFGWRRPSYLPVFNKLLEYGINVNHQDINGTTILTIITREYGDKLTADRDKDGNFNLKEKAQEQFDVEMQYIEALLKHGADPTIKNKFETSAIDWINHRKAMGEYDHRDEKLDTRMAQLEIRK